VSISEIRDAIERGRLYLLSKIINGLCLEFYQLRHGPSWAWTTVCVGSTLSEFGAVPEELLDAVLKLQRFEGGWSYNQVVPADADTTLRVLQFFYKIEFDDRVILTQAEKFVLAHQRSDGGFATYRVEAIKAMGYQNVTGWVGSHPCVTALAINQIHDEAAKQKARWYLRNYLKFRGPKSYWWITPYYILYEVGCLKDVGVGVDPVEISLALLLKAKFGISDGKLVKRLLSLQEDQGNFPPSRQFRIPRPDKRLVDFTGSEEVVEDGQGIFSTCAAIVALSRQLKLC